MQIRQRNLFTTIRSEGAILPPDTLRRIIELDRDLGGLTPDDYHLPSGTKINEAINQSWNRCLGAWSAFRTARARLDASDPATTATREKWLLPLFQELGYGRLSPRPAIEIGGRAYPVSHHWNHVPIHLVGAGLRLDERTPGAAGAAHSSPHSLVQELLNRSDDHLWGLVSNGLRLRLLRDNVSLTRQAFVEFDLEAMIEGEVYSDFVLLWLLCHESRFYGERPADCRLERWTKIAFEQGTRALDQLRVGVENAIKALGRGFAAHPANRALVERLRNRELTKEDYYRQLLRLVYRMLFLFVAEDRDLIFAPETDQKTRERYLQYYSIGRLRRLAERRTGSRHGDLYRGLRLVMGKLGDAEGCIELGLPALGGFLFSSAAIVDLEGCEIANADLLDAVRALAFIQDRHGLRPIDYRNLRSDELGSVYEALLELHPVINIEATDRAERFRLETASGNERKTTGSYYTPESLVQCLLDSALDPVIDEALKQPDPERALLALKVCDPACGSGHFLIAAAHRLAKRLAALRTGDEEPSPEATRTALRDVIGHCIYGVDINPMAVELCKVSLWMEALEPGKPLSFLEHRIQCGNSLLGAAPALIKKGIPDEAFKPIEGDDKEVCSEYRKRNKEERKGVRRLPFEPAFHLGDLAGEVLALEAIPDDSIEGIRRKQERYEALVRSSGYLHGQFLADAWCAAFVWKKTRELPYPITEAILREIEANPYRHATGHDGDWMEREVKRLAGQYQFFHWHLAFPDVFRAARAGEEPENEQMGWSGGFDVVLGNPPWERIKLQEKEWFAQREPKIANAPNAAARARMIEELKTGNSALSQLFLEDRRKAEGESHFIRNSNCYPLCGRGDINTYAVFAEANRTLMSERGRVGCIVPSGIATDDTTKDFFREIIESRSLISLYDFQSGPGLFAEIGHARFKFCLMTLAGPKGQRPAASDFAFFLRDAAHLADTDRRFALSAEDIALLNPNTRTCPVFRSRRDAELTKAIYKRVPVLIDENRKDGNPWGIEFLRMLDMSNDSGLFRTGEQLEADGWALDGNKYRRTDRPDAVYLPLYEAKMLHHFDHRYGDYADKPEDSQNTSLPDVPLERLQNPAYVVQPRYWVPASAVEDRLRDRWDREWLLGFRDITNSTNERTVIASMLPRVGVGNNAPLMLFGQITGTPLMNLAANLSSFILDFAARFKVGGTHLNFFIANQLPVLRPMSYRETCRWSPTESIGQWLASRGMELSYTADDLEGYAREFGYSGSPFRWDESRRFLLRCELDAAYLHLYGIERADVDYIMETFPIVKRKDEQAHGEYRTKRVILEIYDEMKRAMDAGEAYRTRLDPPPAHGWTPPEIDAVAPVEPAPSDAAPDPAPDPASDAAADDFHLHPDVYQPGFDFGGDK